MRILITADVVGGVWSYAEELVDALLARGHEIVLAAVGGEPGARQWQWLAGRPDIHFADLNYPLEWMPEPEPGLSESLGALCDLVARTAPDLIHLNQFYYGATDLGAPTLVVAHSDVVSWWHAVKGAPPPDDAWFARYREWVRAGLAGADLAAAPSAWIAARVEEVYGAGPVRVVHNSRAPGRFLAPVGPRARRVVAAGRLWDEAKAVMDLVAAAPLLQEIGEVVVAGPIQHPAGGPDFPSEAPCVRWQGVLDAAALRGLLADAAVYAATSLYEPFGLAPLEAALAGCALVMSDTPTFRELWDGCAVFYPPGDPVALADAAREVLRQEERRLELAAAAQRRALERYHPDRMVEEYEMIYRVLTTWRADSVSTEATGP